MAWALTIIAVLAVLLGIACWMIHLLFKLVRRREAAIKGMHERLDAQKETQGQTLEALQKRIDGLEVECDVQKGIIDSQVEFMRQHGITQPVLAYRQDGSSFPQDFVIYEEP